VKDVDGMCVFFMPRNLLQKNINQIFLNVYKQLDTSTEATFVNNKPVKVGGYFGNIWSTLGETLNFR